MSPSRRCPWERGDGKHYWVLNGPFSGDSLTGRISLARQGRTCNRCGEVDPDWMICAATVGHPMGMTTHFARCEKRGTAERAVRTGDLMHLPEWPTYWYCASHDPVRKAERRKVAPLTQYDYTQIRSVRRSRLMDEIERWDRDEAATEGFCDDEGCEHHECRLHRAFLRYRAPLPKTRDQIEPEDDGSMEPLPMTPSHLRPLGCDWLYAVPSGDRCGAAVAQRLFNTRNEPRGEFCARHAPAALQQLIEREGV